MLTRGRHRLVSFDDAVGGGRFAVVLGRGGERVEIFPFALAVRVVDAIEQFAPQRRVCTATYAVVT